jgi:hypothetical protein
VLVQHVAYAEQVPGTKVAAVLVRCNAGAGTPSSVLYVYDLASSTTSPHLAATLVGETDNWQANSISTNGADLAMPANGFSANNVPRCCPDVRTTLAWHWSGSGYQLVSTVPPHVRLPGG